MIASNLFGDPDEIEKDLFFLECVRWMRVQFGARVCELSRSQDERTLDPALSGIGPAFAQDAGTVEPTRAASTVDTVAPGSLTPTLLPPLTNPDAPNTSARELFARKLTPTPGPAHAYGGYADGCMSGAVALPITHTTDINARMTGALTAAPSS